MSCTVQMSHLTHVFYPQMHVCEIQFCLYCSHGGKKKCKDAVSWVNELPCPLLFVHGLCALGDKAHVGRYCEGLSDIRSEMIQSQVSYHVTTCFFPLGQVCMCGCLTAYLAVEVRGVYTGFDDVQQ